MSLSWRSRSHRERELGDELAAHLRMAIEDRVARGEPREQAVAAVRREFGNEAIVREVTRQMWRGAGLWALTREFGISLRTLARTPTYSIAAVLCLCLGIGATITIFSVLHAILLRPLPYPDADRAVAVRAIHQAGGRSGMTMEQLDAWAGLGSINELGAWRAANYDLTGSEDLPWRAAGAGVSANLFSILGVRPLHGRWFEPNDEAGAVVILAHELWRGRFGSDPDLIGSTIRVAERDHRVVGIMPAGFSFPEGAQIWSPLVAPPFPPDSHILFYDGVIGRLAPGRTPGQARSEFGVLTSAFGATSAYDGWSFDLVTLHEYLTGAVRQPIILLQAAAVLVLLIACSNVAALLLARGARRRRELAIRIAVGADAGRLMQHVLAECAALAVLGGLSGTAAAYAAVRLLPAAFPDGVPSYIDLALHPPVMAATLLVTALVSLGVGIWPARFALRMGHNAIVAGDRTDDRRDESRTRRLLVVGEVAASVLLTILAVTLVRTQLSIEQGLGFRQTGVLSFHLPLPQARYPHDGTASAALNDRVMAGLEVLPGVEKVNRSIRPVPLDDGLITPTVTFRLEHQALPTDASRIAQQLAATHYATPSYLSGLGVPLLRGRQLAAADLDSGESVAVVNETFARRYFPGGDAVGSRIFVESEPGSYSSELAIVGIVADTRHLPPPAEISPALYLPAASGQTYVLETSLSDPLALTGAIRTVVHELDPTLVVDRLQTQTSVVQRVFWRERLQRNVTAGFAATALLLMVFGMHGVVAYTIGQRIPEFGIRRALGASAADIATLVLATGARLAAAGIGAGLLATLALLPVLRRLMSGVEPADSLTAIGVALAVLVIIVASALPAAAHAIRLDPIRAIRGE